MKFAAVIPDVVGMKLGKALGAVAPLKQKRLALSDLGEGAAQVSCLAGEHQRRMRFQAHLDRGQFRRIGVFRHLTNRLFPP